MIEAKITCTWDTSRGEETRVTLSKSFDDLSQIAKLDFLKDCIGELTDLYNKTPLFFENQSGA
jgi:hypothetical protein